MKRSFLHFADPDEPNERTIHEPRPNLPYGWGRLIMSPSP